jgi:DNA invertase Pin-like site-specific DNA recombinase
LTEAYVRVSRDKEAMLHSLAAQVSYYNDYIQKHKDWEYAGIYADEPTTGTKDSRPEFQRLLADCRDGKIDMVITKSISRFARNTVTMLKTVRELKSLNVDVYFEKENIHSISGDGELMLTILASFAQEESRSVSENNLWRVQKSFQKGEPVGFPRMYGYDYHDGQITVNEEQAAVLRQIFDWYLGGIGFTSISRRLNEMGIPTYSGKKWTSKKVNTMMLNEKLTGNSLLQKWFTEDHISKRKKTNRGEKTKYYAEQTHPAIISAEVFEAAMRIRQGRTVRFKTQGDNAVTHPFSGEILCGLCGKKYKRKKSRWIYYWQCSTYLQEGKAACSAKQIPEATIVDLTKEVLWLTEIDGDALKGRIKEIRVPGDNRLAFVFMDGSIVNREWQDRSRRNSWTDEMKQVARERALQRNRGGADE